MSFEVYDYRTTNRNVLITPEIRARLYHMKPGQVDGLHSHDLGHEIFLILQGRCVFEIDGAGTWRVDVDDGTVKVDESGGDADATIAASEETFQQIASGDLNATTAYMTGKLKVRGDMGAAMKLSRLF